MVEDEQTIMGFVEIIDRAIAIAQERINLHANGADDKAPPGALEYIINGLSQYRDQALNGKLPSSGGVVTIGILREVADWGEHANSSLFRAARDLESYYLQRMK